jgi:hypothetical protein
MSDIPRVVFPDYKRKLPVAMTQKGKRPSTGARGFFGTHELPGADCPIQKAAPRRPSGYVTTIGTEPQVAPFRAAITRLQRDMTRLGFVVSQIWEIEKARQKRLEQQPERQRQRLPERHFEALLAFLPGEAAGFAFFHPRVLYLARCAPLLTD